MAKVFVSHASADKEFVDAFVDNILRIGLGMNGDNIFYSSERDTGIPSGAELIHHVRTEVSEATLVVAIITPMYQTRPVCIAELGAAWGRTDPDLFFPLLAPTMERSELQGVIPSALAQQIDDGSALDELSDRVEAALGPLASKTQWGVGKQKWLSAVRTVEKSLQRPDVPTADEHQEMVRELDEVRAALAYTENEVDEWKRKFDELEKAKDATEARRIRVGGSPLDQFHAAVTHAKSTISQLPPPVREAI